MTNRFAKYFKNWKFLILLLRHKKMKNLKCILFIFLLISCRDTINDSRFRNSNYAFYTTNGKSGEWRKIVNGSKNNYQPGDQVYYFFDNGEKFGKINIIDNYDNREEYFYNNDTIVEKIIYKKNQVFKTIKKDGFHIEYYSSKGQILAKGNIKNNKEDGLWEDYYESGIVKRKLNFKNGIKDGDITEYFENGEVSLTGKYWNGNKIDTIIWYFENGSIKQKEIYIVDTVGVKCHGYAKRFYANGNIHKIIPIVNWKREGISEIYYKNGNLQYLTEYKNDEINGSVKAFYLNGRINFVGTAVDGLKDGVFEYYDVLGNFVKYQTYKKGVLE